VPLRAGVVGGAHRVVVRLSLRKGRRCVVHIAATVMLPHHPHTERNTAPHLICSPQPALFLVIRHQPCQGEEGSGGGRGKQFGRERAAPSEGAVARLQSHAMLLRASLTSAGGWVRRCWRTCAPALKNRRLSCTRP
jgi:hypothetical protein